MPWNASFSANNSPRGPPTTTAWQKDLVKRVEKARAAGRFLPVKLYQALYRPTEVSL